MGLLGKLKGFGRVLTGGGAKVFLEADPATVVAPFGVRVKAVVADADLKIDAVYVLVSAQEVVRIDGKQLERTIRERIADFTADGRLDGIASEETTCEFRVNIAGPQTLAANQQYTWQGEIRLPPGSQPTFRGKTCEHVWCLQAGLETLGNDPDSGWIDIKVT